MANRGTGTTPLTRAQHHALYLLKLARKSDPNTDDGVMATETFYDHGPNPHNDPRIVGR